MVRFAGYHTRQGSGFRTVTSKRRPERATAARIFCQGHASSRRVALKGSGPRTGYAFGGAASLACSRSSSGPEVARAWWPLRDPCHRRGAETPGSITQIPANEAQSAYSRRVHDAERPKEEVTSQGFPLAPPETSELLREPDIASDFGGIMSGKRKASSKRCDLTWDSKRPVADRRIPFCVWSLSVRSVHGRGGIVGPDAASLPPCKAHRLDWQD
jgi:hypothetical protein